MDQETRTKWWQSSKSLDSKPLSTKSKAKAKRRRAEYEAHVRALQEWADNGFVSGTGSDDVPYSDDEW
jgi:hypothetical protein